MAFLFACASLMLIIIASRMGWVAFFGGLDGAAAQAIIEAVGLLAAAAVALQIAETIQIFSLRLALNLAPQVLNAGW